MLFFVCVSSPVLALSSLMVVSTLLFLNVLLEKHGGRIRSSGFIFCVYHKNVTLVFM